MSDIQKTHSTVSEEELRCLLGPAPVRTTLRGVDAHCKYRTAFLLFAAWYFLVLLLFFPQQTYSELNLPAGSPDMAQYLQNRGWYLLVLGAVYAYSYLRNWHYERIALVAFALSISGFVMDLVNFYNLIASALPPFVGFLMLLRVVFIGCLLVNALRASWAPAPPRHLWL